MRTTVSNATTDLHQKFQEQNERFQEELLNRHASLHEDLHAKHHDMQKTVVEEIHHFREEVQTKIEKQE